MTRIHRSWQGLGLLVGFVLVPLMTGSGCPTSSDTLLGGQSDSASSQGQSTSSSDPASQTASTGQTRQTNDASTNALDPTTIQILFPNGSEKVELGSIVNVRVFARHATIPDPTIRVFYDRDNNFANGTTTIGTVKASSGGLGWDTHGLSLGQYYVGAEMVGITPAMIDYSDASFSIVPAGQGSGGTGSGSGSGIAGGAADILVDISAPRNQVPLFSPRVFTIRWSTNLLPGEGTARVYVEPDFDEDGVPDGQALQTMIGSPDIDAAQQRLNFDTGGFVGNFFIFIRVNTIDGRSVTAYSPGTLKIQAPVFWVGDLGSKFNASGQKIPQTGSFRGAVLRGVNFFDNLGSAMTPVDNYDNDAAGTNEILVAAQCAKPFLFAQDGRGAGEAYMIYGSTSRLFGDYDVNNAGQTSLPGLIFSGILPNPHANTEVGGNKLAFTVDGQSAPAFSTEGLRGLAVIPDQDYDGKAELVFSFPWCDSYSLYNQVLDGIDPTPYGLLGRLENNGHFLRGGMVVVSSQNPLLASNTAFSRHGDRVMMLQEVGQTFGETGRWRNALDVCPNVNFPLTAASDTVTYPCDGFWQATSPTSTPGLTLEGTGWIDPPRLADPIFADELAIPADPNYLCYPPVIIDINQVDSPPVPTSLGFFYARDGNVRTTDNGYCAGAFPFAPLGLMYIIGTGFYVQNYPANVQPSCGEQHFSIPFEPHGCRILGQTTTQLNTNPPTTANRFGASISLSGDFLAVGAPMRTALKRDVTLMPTDSRFESGEVYLLQMRRPNTRAYEYPWRLPNPPTPPVETILNTDAATFSPGIPEPHNFIIDDVGYTRYPDVDFGVTACNEAFPSHGSYLAGGVFFEMDNPIRIVGAAPTDRVGDTVQGAYDLNNDGVPDLAVGGAGTNSGRGAVYVLYRRQPEIENDYLLERLQLAPTDPNRFNGLMIVGEQGENLGTSLGALGPAALKDDYNRDGFPDLLIGSPNASTANGFESGEAFVLFGGTNLVNGQGGTTISQLMVGQNGQPSKRGMLLIGADDRDRAGETVANAGDVSGDGIPDILIAAPNATVPDIQFRNPGTSTYRSLRVAFQYDSNGDGVPDATGIGIDRNGDGKADPLNDDNYLDVNGNIVYDADDDLTDAGVVYVVFGGTHLKGTISLAEIGTSALPGMVLVGKAGLAMAQFRGEVTPTGNELGGGHTQNGLLSRGISAAGDMDGDGRGDLMISSVLADPDGKTNAGEIYVIYGFAP